jgi:hypothetical protein
MGHSMGSFALGRVPLFSIGIATVLAGLIAGQRASIAQSDTNSTVGDTPSVGSVVTPRFGLQAQSSPPNFLGFNSGVKVGDVTPGKPYVVLQEQTYPSFNGAPQTWMQIAPASKDVETTPKYSYKPGAWVYYGKRGPEGNLTFCDKQSCSDQQM